MADYPEEFLSRTGFAKVKSTISPNLTGPVTSIGNATSISNSINLPGNPTTTTQAPGDNSTKIATTAYTDAAAAAAPGTYTDTKAQDAVGNILADTTSIDFTYDNITPQIFADLTNTTVSAGTYGSASSVSVFAVDAQGRLTTASNSAISISSSAVTDFAEAAQDSIGSILLDTTSIDLTYNDSTPTISADLKDTAVTPGSYGSATKVSTFTVASDGRLTAAGETSISITSGSITDFNEAAQDAVGGILTDTATIDFTYDDAGNKITADLKNTAVTPGTYGSATKSFVGTVDSTGRLTAASETTITVPAPGGSNTQVQYNNSGVFGGMAGLVSDAAGFPNIGEYSTTNPATPSTGLTLFARNRTNKRTLNCIGPLGIITEVAPHFADKFYSAITANGTNNTASVLGTTYTPTGTHSFNAGDTTTTGISGYIKNIVFVSGAGAGGSAGGRTSQSFITGSSSSIGGFDIRFVFWPGQNTSFSGMAWFAGLNGASAILGNADPSSLVNMCGFGIDSTDTNVQWMVNDGTGTATKTDLGANFPGYATPGSSIYPVYYGRIFCEKGGSVIYYSLQRFDVANFASGSSSSNLPSNTVFMQAQVAVTNRASASSAGLAWARITMEQWL